MRSARLSDILERLAEGEEGVTMVEYALIVALIGGALVGIVTTLSNSIGFRLNPANWNISGGS